ncbi:MAG TPA: hypothetical protein VJ831_07485 [Jatrophihabitantaceae bacterium]|nr:hypothetical protein [Jatrophihabitantaceae bacterium]
MDLAGEGLRLGGAVGVGHADQDEQPGPDRADHVAADRHLCPSDSLHHRPHADILPDRTWAGIG